MESFDEVAYVQFLRTWLSGIQIEVDWWAEWFETRGCEWPDDYQRRTDPKPAFSLEHLLGSDNRSPLEVLDVGSGPISPVGIVTDKGSVRLHACDALAPFYQSLLQRFDVHPYVRTEFAMLERLTETYARERFDIVNICNALDHSFNPLLGLYQMIALTRIGGTVCVKHFENEGDRTGYIALHQWNMTERNGDFVIWNPGHEWNISRMFADSLDVTVQRDRSGFPNWITALLRKRKHVECPIRPPEPRVYDSLLLFEAARAFGTRIETDPWHKATVAHT